VFWQDYFWATTTPKFSEKFAALAETNPDGGITEDMEKKFYEGEILKFAVMMYGWGNMSREKTVLFVGSLSESCGLPPDSHQALVKKVDAYHVAQTKAKSAGKGKRKTLQFVSRAHAQHRQTMAVSRADLEKAGIGKESRNLGSGGTVGASADVGGEPPLARSRDTGHKPNITALDAARQRASTPTKSGEAESAVTLAVSSALEEKWNRQRKSVIRKRADTAEPTPTMETQPQQHLPKQNQLQLPTPRLSNRRMAAKSVVINADVTQFISGMLKNQSTAM